MHRRGFLQASAAAAASMVLKVRDAQSAVEGGRAEPQIPRWRGFNLIALLGPKPHAGYHEFDFHWTAKNGFNFVRLPCSYWVWSSPESWETIDETKLRPLDQAIEFGRQYGIHINLCLHRIPGYCVNASQSEPYQLFGSSREGSERALRAAAYHWRYLAARYRQVPSERLSFDLFNEPPFMTDQRRYVEIAKTLIAAIRDVSPGRLIFADGADLGQTPVMGLADQGIVQSTRGYLPKMVSHYKATWVPKSEFESFAVPTWPMTDRHGLVWDHETLRRKLFVPWQPLANLGVPIQVGEWGCYNKTPHAVCLAWMRDLLALWKQAGWGWALWNLRGAFGVLDSGRTDANLEYRDGHWVDRKMLDLLLAN
jgi:endoglucanase